MWWMNLKSLQSWEKDQESHRDFYGSIIYIKNIINCLLWVYHYVRKICSYFKSHGKPGAFSDIFVTPLEFLLWLSNLASPHYWASYSDTVLSAQYGSLPPMISGVPDWGSPPPLFISPLRTSHFHYSPDSYDIVLMTDIASWSFGLPASSLFQFLFILDTITVWTKNGLCNKSEKSGDRKQPDRILWL